MIGTKDGGRSLTPNIIGEARKFKRPEVSQRKQTQGSAKAALKTARDGGSNPPGAIDIHNNFKNSSLFSPACLMISSNVPLSISR